MSAFQRRWSHYGQPGAERPPAFSTANSELVVRFTLSRGTFSSLGIVFLEELLPEYVRSPILVSWKHLGLRLALSVACEYVSCRAFQGFKLPRPHELLRMDYIIYLQFPALLWVELLSDLPRNPRHNHDISAKYQRLPTGRHHNSTPRDSGRCCDLHWYIFRWRRRFFRHSVRQASVSRDLMAHVRFFRNLSVTQDWGPLIPPS